MDDPQDILPRYRLSGPDYALLAAGVLVWVLVVVNPGTGSAVVYLYALLASVVSGAAALAGMAKRVHAVERTIAIVSSLVLFAGSWTFIWAAQRNDQTCFGLRVSKVDAAYFTMATLTTTGFGDLAPKSQRCRALATFQMAGGVLVAVVALGSLVSRAGSD